MIEIPYYFVIKYVGAMFRTSYAACVCDTPIPGVVPIINSNKNVYA